MNWSRKTETLRTRCTRRSSFHYSFLSTLIFPKHRKMDRWWDNSSHWLEQVDGRVFNFLVVCLLLVIGFYVLCCLYSWDFLRFKLCIGGSRLERETAQKLVGLRFWPPYFSDPLVQQENLDYHLPQKSCALSQSRSIWPIIQSPVVCCHPTLR